MDYVEISSDDEDDELIIDYINSTGLDYFTGDDKLFYQIPDVQLKTTVRHTLTKEYVDNLPKTFSFV